MYKNSSACLAILPGLLCDSRMFSRQRDAFPDATVIDGFYGGADRIEAMADYVLERISARASLLGHSMGARVALEIVRKAPERVERLALVDTGVHPVRPDEAEKRYALRALGREAGMAALVEQWLPPMLAPEARKDEQLLDVLRSMCIDAGIETYDAQIAALLHRPSVEDLLPTISCPTFAMVGSADEWSPPAQHERIAAAIPRAQLRVVEGAGHMMPIEKPDDFNLAIAEWLASPTSRN